MLMRWPVPSGKPWTPAIILIVAASPAFAQFTPDRLAVLEYTSTVAFPDPGGPLVIREFAFDGTPGVLMNVPSMGPNAVVNNFSAVNGAALTLTPSGDKLVFTGFTTALTPGFALDQTNSTTLPRAVGTVDAVGNFARPATSTQFDWNRMKAVASDGTRYWAGGGNSGVCYLGPGPAVVVNADQANTNALHFSPNGDLFALRGDGWIYQVGSGSPTTSSPQTALFQASGFDFQLSPDGNVCYTSTTASIRKWVRSGATWTNVYTFSSPGWLVRIAVDFRGPDPVIYGVHNLPTKLVKFIDGGAPIAETILATAPASVNWYGLSFTPGTTCGVGNACDDGNPDTYGDVVQPNCLCVGQLFDCLGIAGGTAIPGTPCDDLDANTGQDAWQVDCTCLGHQVSVGVKVILSGALPTSGTLMNDLLRTLPSFPLTEPYSALSLAPTGGTLSIAPSVLATAGLNAVVDWILVELRSVADPTVIVARRAGLLQRDGDVVDVDGISPLAIPAPSGSYHVAVRHRNHLGAMTASGVTLSTTSVVVDFRPLATATWGSGAQRDKGSFMALWNGNVVRNGHLSYTGAGNDRDPILVAVGSTTPNAGVAGYDVTDVSMNGITSYTGAGNDRDPILVNVGGTTPNSLRLEQLP